MPFARRWAAACYKIDAGNSTLAQALLSNHGVFGPWKVECDVLTLATRAEEPRDDSPYNSSRSHGGYPNSDAYPDS